MSGTTQTDATVALRKLIERHRDEEHLELLSKERRALYESILALRREIGPIGFNVVGEIRKLREHD